MTGLLSALPWLDMFSLLLGLAGSFFVVTGAIGLISPGTFIPWELRRGRGKGALRIYAVIDLIAAGLFLYLGIGRLG